MEIVVLGHLELITVRWREGALVDEVVGVHMAHMAIMAVVAQQL